MADDNRQKSRAFLGEKNIRESDVVFTQLGGSPSKEEYQALTYRVKKLLELLKCVEENYPYFQRL